MKAGFHFTNIEQEIKGIPEVPSLSFICIMNSHFKNMYMKNSGSKISVLIIAIAALTGCSEKEEVPTIDPYAILCSPNKTTDYVNTYTLLREWDFTGFQNVASGSINYPPCSTYKKDGSRMSLEFSPDSISAGGIAAINSYGAKYYLGDSNTLTMDSFISTLMGGTTKLVEFEKRFLLALAATNSYKIENNQLTLFYGPSGDKLLFISSEIIN
jgi:heat shock protein HslJ